MGEAKRRKDAQVGAVSGRSHRRETFARVRKATVGFAVVQGDESPPQILGSGVIVDRSGIILTARHVLEELEVAIYRGRRLPKPPQATAFLLGQAQISVQTDAAGQEMANLDFSYFGAPFKEEVKLSNDADLALLRIDTSQFQPPSLVLDVDHAVYEGDPAATCGWPYGTQLHEGKTILSSFLLGHVSAVVPHPELPPRHRAHYLMQLPVNPGNSGGPVFDPDTGEVYGIVSRRYEPRGIPAGLCVVEPVARLRGALIEWKVLS